MTKISVVVVLFNSADVIADCVRSVPEECELIVVDQNSPDDGIARAVAAAPHARIIMAGANRGFGAGCNLGAANAVGDVTIFLNPDARFAANAPEELRQAVLVHGGTLVGPTLVDEVGETITRARNWSVPWRDALGVLLPPRLVPKRYRADIDPDDRVYRDGGEVPYVQGACMAIDTGLFRAVGGFDEDYFLYGEEEALAVKLRALGLGARIAPGALVTHIGHTSTRKSADLAVAHYFRSRVLMYRKTYGARRGTTGAALLGAALIMLYVSAPVRRPLGLRKTEDAHWCAVALSGVAHGLLARAVRPSPVGPRPTKT